MEIENFIEAEYQKSRYRSRRELSASCLCPVQKQVTASWQVEVQET